MKDETAVRLVLTALDKAGYAPRGVDYGDGESVKVSSVNEAVAEVMSVDEAYVIVVGQTRGWVRFVLGNRDVLDLIADHCSWTGSTEGQGRNDDPTHLGRVVLLHGRSHRDATHPRHLQRREA